MLKISRYITISLFFVIIFLLFLAFNPDFYEIDTTSNLEDLITKADTQTLPSQEKTTAIFADDFSDKETEQLISRTLSFLHQDYMLCDSLNEADNVKNLIIVTPNITDTDIEPLTAFLAKGGSIIFAVFPDIMTEGLMELLGITEFVPDYKVEGFDIYEGIFLGGLFRSEDIPVQCAKVTLSGHCKIFANGHSPNRDKDSWVIDKKYENPLIWRTYHEDGALFAVNAPFLKDPSGIGILTGLLSLSTTDFIYPVIGTSGVILDNFPYITDSDVSIGDRTYDSLIRDIIWPEFVSLSKRSDITYTCYINGNIANDKTACDTFEFLYTELSKTRNGELGYSFGDRTNLSDSKNDLLFLNEYFMITMRSFWLPSESTILNQDISAGATSYLTSDWNSALTWVTDQSILLPVVSSGLEDEYTSFLYTSIASSLGLVLHHIDMEPVFTGEIAWNEYSLDIQRYLSGLFQKFTFLQPSAVSKTAEVAKNYLNLNVKTVCEEEKMELFLSDNNSEVSFLLRTTKKVDIMNCINCSVSNLEEGVYLIKSSSDRLTIHFE